jgi:hypothetical protein
MTQVAIAAATLVAAVTLTYVFCVRPMRRGRSVGETCTQRPETRDDAAPGAELAALRAQLADLQGGAHAGDGPAEVTFRT